jgi:hypothetical protein
MPRTPQIINIPSSFVPWQLEKYLIRSPGMKVKTEDEGQSARWGITPIKPVQRPEFKNPQQCRAVRSLGQLRV